MATKPSQSKARKPRTDAQRNRERILEVAKQAFSQSGASASLDEIVRLARLFVRAGVRKVRLTGGKPTLRAEELLGVDGEGDLAKLVALAGFQSVGMTSNGVALHRRLPEFVKDGLTHLNLSLDTLEPAKLRS